MMDSIQLTLDVPFKRNNHCIAVESTTSVCFNELEPFFSDFSHHLMDAKVCVNYIHKNVQIHYISLSRNNSTPLFRINASVFKKCHLAETPSPLLISYLAWLRMLNGTLNKTDVTHQKEQMDSKFRFLWTHNLLFFLTVTKQFNVIEKLFGTPSLMTQVHHLMTLIKNERDTTKQIKKKQLLQLTHQPNNKHRLPLEKRHHESINNIPQRLYFFMHNGEKSLINSKNTQKKETIQHALTQFNLTQ